MQFYNISGVVSDMNWVSENEDKSVFSIRKTEIRKRTFSFNREHPNSYWFVSDIRDNEVIGGVISRETAVDYKAAVEFFKALGIGVDFVSVEETIFSMIRSMLEESSNGMFVSDNDDKVMCDFGLSRLYGFRSIDFGEVIIEDDFDKKKLVKRANKYISGESLVPEIERIYLGKAQPGYGHPVHYMVETDDRHKTEKLCETLISALYDNGRLNSKRFCFIDLVYGRQFQEMSLDVLYKSCEGSAIVIRDHLGEENDEDDEVTTDENGIVSLVCNMIEKHKNKVLSIVCLPRECTRKKRMYLENLGAIGFVEIKEDLADHEKSCAYLRRLAKKREIRPDKNLYEKLSADKVYLPSELDGIFESWYDTKLKTTVFPQYKDVVSYRPTALKEKARGNAYDDLFGMIGLSEAKNVITKALNYYKVRRLFKAGGVNQDVPTLHMVFTGNPGTAKTTVARLFAKIMKENGVLSKGHLVEVGRKDLVGKFVGWTAKNVQAKFKEAMGGVLFIDEAYSLVDERGGSFGDEAINTIVQEMENRREGLVVIFAGYPDKMREFLDKNPGLSSRIAFHVPFSDYSPDELCAIAKHIGKSKGVKFTDGAMGKMRRAFESASKTPDFGNGRYVRNLIELSKMNLASRVVDLDPDDINESVLTTIEEQDVELPHITGEKVKKSVGFVS